VAAGAVHSIIGPNGAGKTTVLNLVTGVLAPSAGRIVFDGTEIGGARPHHLAARGLSRTFQNLQIFFNMTALENVMVGAHLRSERRLLPVLLRLGGFAAVERRRRDEAASLMEELGLARYVDAPADALPYGALKRLEIARALASEPRALLLDEPAAGCNPVETSELDRLIKAVAAQGIAVVLVEHDMKLVMKISDRILVLDHGRPLAEGEPQAVRQNPAVIEAYLGRHGGREAARAHG
jgi:branched-chain amino acid transport system ATP-binding protein